MDLSSHLRMRPWANYGLIFVVLMVVLAWREPERARSQRDGYLLLATGLVLQGIAVGGATARWGRLALPLGVLGMARLLGRPSPRVAALALWAVPLPSFVASLTSPFLERLWLEAAVLLLAPLSTLLVQGTSVSAAGGVLELDEVSGGLPLAALLSGLGWVQAIGCWSGLAPAVRRATLWGLVAFPLQALSVLAAVALTAAGAPGVARAWLSWGIFLASGAVGLAIVAWSRSTLRE